MSEIDERARLHLRVYGTAVLRHDGIRWVLVEDPRKAVHLVEHAEFSVTRK